MSRYWGLECKTCNESSDDSLNHGDGILRDLAKNWPLLRAALDAAGEAEGWLEIGLMGHDGIVSFLREHDEHDLWLLDEYHKEDAPLNIPTREKVATEQAAAILALFDAFIDTHYWPPEPRGGKEPPKDELLAHLLATLQPGKVAP